MHYTALRCRPATPGFHHASKSLRRAMSVQTKATSSPAESLAPSENFKGDVLDPSAFNKNWVGKCLHIRCHIILLKSAGSLPMHVSQVRLLAVGAAVALAARSTGYLPVKAASFIHLLAFAANFGMIFWVRTNSLRCARTAQAYLLCPHV